MIKIKYCNPKSTCPKEVKENTFENEQDYREFCNSPNIIVLEVERDGADALNRIFG